MKLVNFYRRAKESGLALGCILEEMCVDLSRAIADGAVKFPKLAGTIEDVLHTENGLSQLQTELFRAHRACSGIMEHSFPLSEVRYAAPILKPQKLIGIGFNYLDHARETQAPIPKEPLFFAMCANAITGHLDPIVKPTVTEMLDYEAELALIIGKPGRYIPIETALDHIAGYTALNDVSARNFLATDSQWLRLKSFDTFAPMGPCMVTRDELGDGSGLNIQCRVNGELRQNSNTRYLIFNAAYLVSYLSNVMTLQPGDVISTGTPGGVGFARHPQIFLKAGDVVEVEIEKIGTLRNMVVLD